MTRTVSLVLVSPGGESLGALCRGGRAAVCAGFLARIEPAEWPHHAGDVPRCLAEAVQEA